MAGYCLGRRNTKSRHQQAMGSAVLPNPLHEPPALCQPRPFTTNYSQQEARRCGHVIERPPPRNEVGAIQGRRLPALIPPERGRHPLEPHTCYRFAQQRRRSAAPTSLHVCDGLERTTITPALSVEDGFGSLRADNPSDVGSRVGPMACRRCAVLAHRVHGTMPLPSARRGRQPTTLPLRSKAPLQHASTRRSAPANDYSESA